MVRTLQEKSTELISTADMPWGNTQLAVEYLGGQTDRESKVRYMVRGAGFFEIQNGKITRARIYTPSEEVSVVTGPFKIM
jgi:cupin superfamily acireductone dioxygenase involved in methionine salvage